MKTLDQQTVEKIARLKLELIKEVVEFYGDELLDIDVDDIEFNYKQDIESLDDNLDWKKNFTQALHEYKQSKSGPTSDNDSQGLFGQMYDSVSSFFNKMFKPDGKFHVGAALARMNTPVSFNLSKFKGQKIPTQGKSVGGCATAVRTFLEAGGIDTNGRPGAAQDYVGFLPRKGFEHVATLSGRQAQSSFTPKPGDISVMSHGKYGHICMWNGNQWVSDFPQNNMWPYSGDGVCNIFRHTNIV